MKLYYVSHPYDGKPENAAKADVICRALQKLWPDDVYISPIHAIRGDYQKTDYVVGLSWCTELLKRCDGIVMCGNWEISTGCVTEYMVARGLKMDVMTARGLLWNDEEDKPYNDEAYAYAIGEAFE